MSKNTNKDTTKLNNKDNFYLGMIILGLSALLFAIFIGVFGTAGRAITNFFVGVFGYAVYGYALAGIIFGLLKIFKGKTQANWKLKLMCYALIILVVAVCHLYTARPLSVMAYGKYLSNCYTTHSTMGGVIGGIFLYPLGKAYIASVVFLCLFIAGCVAMIIVFLIDKDFSRKSSEGYIISRKPKKINMKATELNFSEDDNVNIAIGQDLNNTDINGNKLPTKFVRPFAKTKGNLATLEECFEEEIQPQEEISPFQPTEVISDNEINRLKEDILRAKTLDSKSDGDKTGRSIIDDLKDVKPTISPDENDFRYKEYSTRERENFITRRLNKDNETPSYLKKFESRNSYQNPNHYNINNDTSFGYPRKDVPNLDSNKSGTDATDDIVKEIEKKLDTALNSKDSISNTSVLNNFSKDTNKVDNDRVEDFSNIENTAETEESDDIFAMDNKLVAQYDNIKKQDEPENKIVANPVKKVEIESSFEPVEESKQEEIVEIKPKFIMPEIRPQKEEEPTPTVVPQVEVKHEKYAYIAPKLDLLNDYNSTASAVKNWEIARKLEDKLKALKIGDAVVENIVTGPKFTRYEISVPEGVKATVFDSINKDIQKALASKDPVNINCPIPGKDLVGIEVANEKSSIVGLKEILASREFNRTDDKGIYFALGKDIDNNYYVGDISDFPHAIVAGATGSGKSVCLNTMLVSLLYKYSPEQLRLIIVDPKMVEFVPFNGIPHLMLDEAITESTKAIQALQWACEEMDNRFRIMSKNRCSSINDYNSNMKASGGQILPFILIVLDEFADLMTDKIHCKAIENHIKRLGQKARAAGIHVILATQRPNVKTITGDIKSNALARIAFKVSSRVDSGIILDTKGAENLLGYGDMLFKDKNLQTPIRIQGSFVSTNEIYAVTDYIKEHNENYKENSLANYLDNQEQAEKLKEQKEHEKPKADSNIEREKTIRKVLDYLVDCEYASVNALRKEFDFGHPKASKLLDILIKRNFVSSDIENQTKGRRVLITREEFEELYKDFDADLGETDDGQDGEEYDY